MAEIIRSKDVKVRKGTICFGCGRKFAAGSEMRLDVVVDAGTAWNCHLCKTCVEVTNEMEFGDEFGFGDLFYDALEIEAHGSNRSAK